MNAGSRCLFCHLCSRHSPYLLQGAAVLGRIFMTADYEDAMEYMGLLTIVTALLTPLIVVKGYKGIVLGKDDPVDSASRRQHSPLMVPGKLTNSPHLVSLRVKRQRQARR